MMKKILAAVAAAALLILWRVNAAPSSSHAGTLSVPPGTGAGQVVRQLKADGQVRSTLWFRFLLKATGTGRRIKTGIYPVEEGLSAWDLVRLLGAGRGLVYKVTVPEGWTADRVAERLEAAGVCGRQAFRTAVSSAAAEGFLFPDTYEFDPFISAEKVEGLMAARFEDAWRKALALSSATVEVSSVSVRRDRVRINGKWWSAGEVVTLASIVERESGKAEERPLIAAVYHNRLRKGMKLEADPTVQYALGRWKERLLYKDLEVNSPYNTYRRAGLPPGPIGSPGLESLTAALAPAPAAYLYFVADEGGAHKFSLTYAEHLRNVRERAIRLHRRPPP